MAKKETVNVRGTEISLPTHRQDDYISLTDMAKYKNPDATGLILVLILLNAIVGRNTRNKRK